MVWNERVEAAYDAMCAIQRFRDKVTLFESEETLATLDKLLLDAKNEISIYIEKVW